MTLFSQNETETDDKYQVINDNLFKEFSIDMVYIELKLRWLNAFVSVHPRKERLINFEKVQSIKYKIKENTTHFVQYERIKVKSLPKPYETDCIDYRKHNYISRQNCISKCRFEYLSKNWTDV